MSWKSRFRNVLGFSVGAATTAVTFFPGKTKKLFRILMATAPVIEKADEVLGEEAKYCPKCGKEVDPISSYCAWCGAELPV